MSVVLRRPCPHCTAIVEWEVPPEGLARSGQVQCECGELLGTSSFPGQTAETHAVIDTDLENVKSLRSIAVSLQILAGKVLVEAGDVDPSVVNELIRAKVESLPK